MKNWKTTLIGAMLAVAGFVVFSPDSFGGTDTLLFKFCSYTMAGGLATLGVVAKDS